ncbi:MAG TPA: glycoside hydrolase family 30 protein [Lacibacter sp.]|nr:glycoside hydrolase family 30 protein [Lacibacter sp.]HMO90120.1 glycoside hydrolase family 30 protein [Lacibacter sp.]HMP85861.1 glycoside hydrolase family 30 protein [Lacibacter sp.]
MQQAEMVETSAAGSQLRAVQPLAASSSGITIALDPEQRFQQITGFGGSFTEASASLLQRLSPGNRARILQAYFGEEGARYSLTRTHINSCDFSLGQYAYANTPGDTGLTDFSIAEDRPDIIPMIKEAQQYSKEGFKIIASPWTAPPWMKDNNKWVGGKLLPQYRAAWSLYFARYIQAYRQEGIDIWGVTVENEPLGNGNNWESMHYTPEEMAGFVRDYLSPRLKQEGLGAVKILGYDQNRGEELEEWARAQYADAATSAAFDGIAVHWYNSTFDFFPASLQYAHRLAPGKHMINTEACVDAQVPRWKDDAWYWSKEATDWGWTWAPAERKKYHPKYEPVYRYARDIIGCLNNHVDGWVDWNMVLDRQGGPNWFKNWCTAPVIVDPEQDEVYFTPLFYTLAHFSRYIRPGTVRIGWTCADADLQVTAAQNPDGSVVAVVFNPGTSEKMVNLTLRGKSTGSRIAPASIQTIVITPNT